MMMTEWSCSWSGRCSSPRRSSSRRCRCSCSCSFCSSSSRHLLPEIHPLSRRYAILPLLNILLIVQWDNVARSTCPVKRRLSACFHSACLRQIIHCSGQCRALSALSVFHTWHHNVSIKHALRPCCLAEQLLLAAR